MLRTRFSRLMDRLLPLTCPPELGKTYNIAITCGAEQCRKSPTAQMGKGMGFSVRSDDFGGDSVMKDGRYFLARVSKFLPEQQVLLEN
jgi:hypothetical protein